MSFASLLFSLLGHFGTIGTNAAIGDILDEGFENEKLGGFWKEIHKRWTNEVFGIMSNLGLI